MIISLKEWMKKVLNYIAAPKWLIVAESFYFTGATYMSWKVPARTGYKCIGVIGYRAIGDVRATNDAFDIFVDYSSQTVNVSNSSITSSSYGIMFNLLYVADIVGGTA